ncbi:MAG: serine/threonine protein kinase, partial [Calditrichaeota bacterium]|nr:serine/threonine protein kinase [Calditrichota bacterium]
SLYALMSIGLVVAGRWVVANWRSLINIRARRISHFKLLSPLGKGGMGEVYKALDLNTREFVAIKLLHPEIMKDTQNRKRLTNEGRLLASFSHPNVVRVFELGETGREMFIAMEYLSGGTLQEFLEKNHPIEPARLLVLLREIAGGLAAIHREKIVHRDLKPGNLMLDEQGQVRIMDFGLSKSPLVTTMTSLGTVLGTLGYVAPEQITGAGVDHRVDIFSFGVVMFVMATNKAPFSGENEMALIHAIFNYTPPDVRDIRTDLPEGYSEMVRRCLQKDPADRYPDMAAILGALETL